MRTTTYKALLEGLLARAKLSLSATPADEVGAVMAYVADRFTFAWEYAYWPEILVVEDRWFREAWAASIYAANAEVYHAGTDKYWTTTAGATADEVPGTAATWTELTAFRRTVGYAQAGKQEIGACSRIWDVDPYVYPTAVTLDFALSPDGLEVLSDSGTTSVWVRYRRRAPDLAAAVIYSALDTYAAEQVVYWGTDCYLVLATTTAGDTPSSAPTKWEKIEIPAWLAPAIKAGAYADWLNANGQGEKAANWEQQFIGLLDEQVSQITTLQGQTIGW